MNFYSVAWGVLLAAGDTAPGVTFSRSKGLVLKDVLLILGAAAALGLLLVLVATMRASRRRHRSRHGERPVIGSVPPEQRPSSHRHHRHRRRRRRSGSSSEELRSRNPTLAETGGLPPVRQEEGSTPPSI